MHEQLPLLPNESNDRRGAAASSSSDKADHSEDHHNERDPAPATSAPASGGQPEAQEETDARVDEISESDDDWARQFQYCTSLEAGGQPAARDKTDARLAEGSESHDDWMSQFCLAMFWLNGFPVGGYRPRPPSELTYVEQDSDNMRQRCMLDTKHRTPTRAELPRVPSITMPTPDATHRPPTMRLFYEAMMRRRSKRAKLREAMRRFLWLDFPPYFVLLMFRTRQAYARVPIHKVLNNARSAREPKSSGT